MSYQSSLTHERVFSVRWQEPEEEDVTSILAEIRRLSSKVGDKIIYLGIVPQECTMPSDAVRTAFEDNARAMNEFCSSIHMVLLGSGLKFVAIRSSVAGMLLFKGTRKMHVDATVQAALERSDLKPELVRGACEDIERELLCGLRPSA